MTGPRARRINVHSDVEDFFSGSGNDQITGTDAANFIAGGFGNDLIVAGAGNDRMVGGDGTDTIRGGEGTDVFFVDDGTRDDFDAKLFNSGYPRGDFVFGDPF